MNTCTVWRDMCNFTRDQHIVSYRHQQVGEHYLEAQCSAGMRRPVIDGVRLSYLI